MDPEVFRSMVYNTQNYWVFGYCPSAGIEKKY
jgi:hypothetical protein